MNPEEFKIYWEQMVRCTDKQLDTIKTWCRDELDRRWDERMREK